MSLLAEKCSRKPSIDNLGMLVNPMKNSNQLDPKKEIPISHFMVLINIYRIYVLPCIGYGTKHPIEAPVNNYKNRRSRDKRSGR